MKEGWKPEKREIAVPIPLRFSDVFTDIVEEH